MHLKLQGGKENKTLARRFYRQDYKISIASLRYIKQWRTNIKFEFVFWKCAQLGRYLIP